MLLGLQVVVMEPTLQHLGPQLAACAHGIPAGTQMYFDCQAAHQSQMRAGAIGAGTTVKHTSVPEKHCLLTRGCRQCQGHPLQQIPQRERYLCTSAMGRDS